jgi:cysteine desulfurase
MQGVPVQFLAVDAQGQLQPGALQAALQAHPRAVVALMAANNETGVLHPVKDLVPLVHAAGGLFFCDLSQAAGKLAVDVHAWDLDLAAASATKFGGPQGRGLLWKRKGLKLAPLLHGGHQEGGLRPGTEDVAGAAGLAAALTAAEAGRERQAKDWAKAVQALESGLRERYPALQVQGAGALRVSNTLCASFPGLDRDLLLIRLDQLGLQASAGAACVSGANVPSPVLQAMGASPEAVRTAVRFSLGPGQGEAEALAALRVVDQAFAGFRAAGLLPRA